MVGSGTAVAEVACARKVGEYAHFRKVVGGGFGTCAGFRFTACYGGGETNLPGGHKAFVLAVAAGAQGAQQRNQDVRAFHSSRHIHCLLLLLKKFVVCPEKDIQP